MIHEKAASERVKVYLRKGECDMKRVIVAAGMMLAVVLSGLASERGFSGDASFGLSSTSGNSDTTSVSFTFTADRQLSERYKWLNKGSYLWSDADGETTSDRTSLDTRLEWHPRERFFGYVQAGYLRDQFKDFDYRLTPGIGAGWTVLKRADKTLDLTAGLSGVFTSYRISGETDSYTAVQLGNTFKWKITDTADLSQSLRFSADISELDRYFIEFEMSLAVSINSRWGLKVSVTDNYESRPPSPDIKKNDTALIAGITYRF